MTQIREENKSKKYLAKLAFLRYYKLIILAAVVAIFGLSYYFVLQPQYEEIKSGGQYNLETIKNDLAAKNSYRQNLKTMIENYRKLNENETEKINVILPSEKDMAGLFVQFQALAQNNNLLLAGVSINQSAESKSSINATSTFSLGSIKKLNVTLNLMGTQKSDYNEIKDFLSAIENNLRIFDIDAVYFNPDSSGYSINLVTYYLEK